MATHFVKVGDRYPILVATLLKPDGTAQDLTGYTVKLLMRKRDATTLKVNAAASIISPTAGTRTRLRAISRFACVAVGGVLIRC